LEELPPEDLVLPAEERELPPEDRLLPTDGIDRLLGARVLPTDERDLLPVVDREPPTELDRGAEYRPKLLPTDVGERDPEGLSLDDAGGRL
jgi:hypothetical protein